MLALSSATYAFAPAALVAPQAQRASTVVMETVADLEVLAKKLNPTIGFYDPLGLADANFWGKGEDATVGFLRHAEIKHGRIAMFAFVGYCVQANGIHFPFQLTTAGTTYADISAVGFPNEQWDALPTNSKLQILAAIGFLEFIGEIPQAGGEKHYMKGGKPGYYPPLKSAEQIPHPVPFNLFDPFGLSSNASAEKKERGLLAEINNGRLAMIGIFGFMSAAKGMVVPGLDFIPFYAGEPMGFFSAVDSKLPLVPEMLDAFKGAAFPIYK